MRIPGLYTCGCGNSIPIATLVSRTGGISGPVFVFPYDVVCGCGKRMQICEEDEEIRDGQLSSLPGRDHVDSFGGRAVHEDPAGRAPAEGQRGGPLRGDQVDGPAAGAEGEPRVDEARAGGSPDDLPGAASHLAIGESYLLLGGDFVDHVGELTRVEVSGFGHVYCILDVTVSPGVVEKDVRIVDHQLTPL